MTLSVRYEQVPGSSTSSVDPGCPHHYAPSNLTVSTDWGETARLQEIGSATNNAQLTSATPGNHWLRLIDIAYCGSEFGALATTGLFLNSVPLTRFEPVADGSPAFVFTLTPNGRLQ